MDGVVADFDRYALETLGVPPSNGVYPFEIWNQLIQNPRLYRDLQKTPYADILVSKCQKFAIDNYYEMMFLTAVPKGNDVHWAFYDKVLWAQAYFPNIPVHFGPYSKDKHIHCNTGDILIDDRQSNIVEWQQAGGIAIHHVDPTTTLNQLNEYSNCR
jgi:5'(3')-deoxyribonucleotidase